MTPAQTEQAERPDLVRFSVLLLQLIGIAWLIGRFQIESNAFFQLTVLTVAGFAIHYFLPLRHRVPFFLLLSLAGIGLVLGVVQGAWVVALGLGLIGIAHLPARISIRAALLLAACAGFFLIRTRFEVPWSAAVWPVLASMFMFRMIVYMYDQATGQGQATLSQRLSYFFLLPNVCFPLFPVIDFRTWVRTYYSAPRHEIYQVGVIWMVRGIVQLLLYRFVQLWLVVDPYDVDSLQTLSQYFVWLYLLYLSISGQFHVIVGMLHLFGFGLPETHRRYYLASSFTDFWRRINIYWKDFMMKVFYYPTFFRLRRLGQTPALVLATIVVFVVTWGLHAYQGFWIRGFFHFSWNDTLFWTILCALVVVNALHEARHGRRRSLSPQTPSWRDRLMLAVKTAGTFAVICVLWSFWSSESVESWLSLWPAAFEPGLSGPNRIFVWLAATGIGGALLSAAWRSYAVRWPQPGFMVRAAGATAWLGLLAAASTPQVLAALGSQGELLASIRAPRLNGNQLGDLERGYYEDLLTVDRFNQELAALYDKRPRHWELDLRDLGASRRGAEPGEEILPNVEVFFSGAMFRSNQWGMHDKEYTREVPPNTFRIALIGASHVMGMGVERQATFEAVLEDRLNREAAARGAVRYEILNFAHPQYLAFHQIHVLENKVAAFNPHVAIYVGHPYDLKRHVSYVHGAVRGSQQFEYPWFRELADKAGVDGETSKYLARRRLTGVGDELLVRLFGVFVETARRHQIQPVYLHMPLTPESRNEVDTTPYVELAARAGFTTLDLTGVYDGHTREEIWVAEWDAHPNELGHRLVADRLYALIHQQGQRVFEYARVLASLNGTE